jgi:hypothetical protein
MHHRLVLAAIAGLSVSGCARNSAIVEGDPFNTPPRQVTIDHRRSALATAAPPAGAQAKQTVTVDEHKIDEANFDSPSKLAPESAESWPAEPPTKDGIKVPVNARTGYFSAEYGVGTRIN